MIIFYAINGVGLGHLSRTLGIASAIRATDPHYPIVFITEATDSRIVKQYPFAFYQIPNRDALFLERRWRDLNQEAVLRAWTGILDSILQAYSPKLIVYDTYIWPEFQILVRKKRIRQALIMRKQRDLQQWLHDQMPILEDMDLIVFPHHELELGGLTLPPYISASKATFSGPVLRRSISDLDPSFDREAFGLNKDSFLITITNGGGNALKEKSDDFIYVVTEAIKLVELKLPFFQIMLILGPMSSQFIPFTTLRKGDVIIKEYEPNLLELFSISNLVIARGGYNTILELSEIGVPSLCIPAIRYHDDQRQRIQQASQKSPNIQYSSLDSKQIANNIAQIADQSRWKYLRSKSADMIAENKAKLAELLISIAKAQYD